MPFLKLDGFMRDSDLLNMFRGCGYTKGAEIGVAKGEYSRMMLEKIPNLGLICVDPWEKYDYDRSGMASWCKIDPKEDYRCALQNTSNCNVRILRMSSMEAVKHIPEESLDFVYIDANHYYEYVKQDLIEWGKRVRLGGIVSGHDYLINLNCDVKRAVDEYVHENGVLEWFITGDFSPSYFWVK